MCSDIVSFIIYMIHELSHETHESPSVVYKKLNAAGCIQNYLVPHYDILHTQSSEYIMNDIKAYLVARGVQL